jgi:hypothetical protein
MANNTQSPEYPGVNPSHVGLLEASLQAPSAHNAQPWLIKPGSDGQYELHYNQTPDLPADPSDKDAYLTMGAFAETMVLEGPNHNLDVVVTPELTRHGRDIFMATVALSELNEGRPVDPLSAWIGQRVTNRNSYKSDPLPDTLKSELKDLGNTLVDSQDLAGVILDATMKSWGDPEYIHDLEAWFHKNNDSEVGITPAPFNISKADIVALRIAFSRGGFKSRLMQYFCSDRDVKTFTSGPDAAVLSVSEMSPEELFSSGQRLLRSWVTAISHGESYQPFSVAVDKEEPAARVAEIAGIDGIPVALYRVGAATEPPRGRSNRKPLSSVLI